MRTVPTKPNANALGWSFVALRPETAGSYVQLAHGYAAMSQWDGVGEERARMRHLGLRKTPGWSFLHLNGIITAFFVDSSSHLSRYKEMIFLLRILCGEMRGGRQSVTNGQGKAIHYIKQN